MLDDPATSSPRPIVLRRATAADAVAAAQLIADVLAEHGLPFEPEGRDADVVTFGGRDDHDDLVAEKELLRASGDRGTNARPEDARIIGVVSVGPQGDEGRAWLSKLFVARDARRHGVGRLLLEAAHEAARKRGYREIGLRTRAIFHEAMRLYESAGYVRHASAGAHGAGDIVLERTL